MCSLVIRLLKCFMGEKEQIMKLVFRRRCAGGTEVKQKVGDSDEEDPGGSLKVTLIRRPSPN